MSFNNIPNAIANAVDRPSRSRLSRLFVLQSLLLALPFSTATSTRSSGPGHGLPSYLTPPALPIGILRQVSAQVHVRLPAGNKAAYNPLYDKKSHLELARQFLELVFQMVAPGNAVIFSHTCTSRGSKARLTDSTIGAPVLLYIPIYFLFFSLSSFSSSPSSTLICAPLTRCVRGRPDFFSYIIIPEAVRFSIRIIIFRQT